ncbi:MAG: hypothetical protein EBS41_01590 [Actinobacteria bacterium]|jgi:hypothetical protein|nr:hypothetical protein [Actinomycetota bacterium]
MTATTPHSSAIATLAMNADTNAEKPLEAHRDITTVTWQSPTAERRRARIAVNDAASNSLRQSPIVRFGPQSLTTAEHDDHQKTPAARNAEPELHATNPGRTEPETTAELEMSTRVLRMVAEIHAGLRPVHQCIRWTTASTYAQLSRAHARASSLAARGVQPGPIVVIGIHSQCIDSSVVETCATVVARRGDGTSRARALAICIRRHRGGWWVTSIDC